MLVGLFTDVHWSKTTCIVRQQGKTFTERLELLIKGMNWAMDLFEKEGCSKCICLGDFFDKPNLQEIEISSIKEVNWKLPVDFIVGNHESTQSNLQFASTDIFNKKFKIIKNVEMIEDDNNQYYFLPYVAESQRKPLREYLTNYNENKKHIIFSHNDISGISYGRIESKVGFSISEIEDCSDLYLNGHIHNSEWITKKILNLGSMSAHNFSNDSFKYKYGVWILDTDTLELKFYENPFSLNFYTIELEKEKDLEVVKDLKPNAVVSFRCYNNLREAVLKAVGESKNILTHKFILKQQEGSPEASENATAMIQTNHIQQFCEFFVNNYGTNDIIKEELSEVCK